MQGGKELTKKYTETNELLQKLVMCNRINHMDIQRPCVIFFKISNSQLNVPHDLVITASVFWDHISTVSNSSFYSPATSVAVK